MLFGFSIIREYPYTAIWLITCCLVLIIIPEYFRRKKIKIKIDNWSKALLLALLIIFTCVGLYKEKKAIKRNPYYITNGESENTNKVVTPVYDDQFLEETFYYNPNNEDMTLQFYEEENNYYARVYWANHRDEKIENLVQKGNLYFVKGSKVNEYYKFNSNEVQMYDDKGFYGSAYKK